MRINKLLSNFGYCSRADTRKLIDENRIKVNGKLAIQGQWVEIDQDDILVDNKAIEMKERVYIGLNKPVGITCTADNNKKDNIIEYMNYKQYIFPVGRLDKASQGLIILTNDGDFANNIISAKNAHEKEYIVTVDKEFDDKFLRAMEKGVDIGSHITKPCKMKRLSKNSFKITLTQGLNKQIRRMCLVLSYKVQKLERIRIMNIKLNEIKCGDWRYLTEKEIYEIEKGFNL